jgi:putative protease
MNIDPDEKLEKVGKISHYYGNIKVAVIELSGPLKVGDVIRIVGGENTDFIQPVKSIQIDHKKIEKAKKGESIGLKVKEKTREGYLVYKL